MLAGEEFQYAYISTQAVKHTCCVQYTADRRYTIKQAHVKV